jgi:hypothetical protein
MPHSWPLSTHVAHACFPLVLLLQMVREQVGKERRQELFSFAAASVLEVSNWMCKGLFLPGQGCGR